MTHTWYARLRLLVFPAILLFGMTAGHGTEPLVAPRSASTTTAQEAPITDPALVGKRYREVLARPEFQEAVEPGVDARFQEMLSQWFLRLGAKIGEFKYASRIPAIESLLMTLLVGFAIAGLVYIMARLTRRRIDREEESGSHIAGLDAHRSPEFFAAQIHEAIQARDWHTAWLTAWRQFLSRLEKGRLVEADRTHTNREYLSQLLARPLPAPALALLTGLVDAYDKFIYGRQTIGEPDWIFFHQQLDEAALLLHLDDKSAPAAPRPNAR